MKLNELRVALSDNWDKREPRERRILMVVGLLVLLSAVYLMGIAPAQSHIRSLQQATPQLKQQAAMMTAMAEQYGFVSKALHDAVPPITRETIESTLARRNIKTQSLIVSGDVVRFQVNAVAYSSMMEWLLEMQKAARLTVDEAKLVALTDPGQVSIVLTLRQQKSAQ
ncbi:MAG: type II secretion system protein M [Burkholderiales bacterium]|nr:type II secretion system protein M [Burkholderiales bacterium]